MFGIFIYIYIIIQVNIRIDPTKSDNIVPHTRYITIPTDSPNKLLLYSIFNILEQYI